MGTRVAWRIAMVIGLGVVGGSLLEAAGRTSTAPLRVVDSLDLKRYAGRWYEVARFPNKSQEKCARDVTASYALRADGRIDVVNRCRKADGRMVDTHGIARKAGDGQNSARLEMRFGSPLFGGGWSDYWIIGLGPDYTWAVVGEPSRERLWILSRVPEMSALSYERALEIAKGNTFDVTRLVRTPQSER